MTSYHRLTLEKKCAAKAATAPALVFGTSPDLLDNFVAASLCTRNDVVLRWISRFRWTCDVVSCSKPAAAT